jgi:uncharacterized damage-inducible protein DinB
MIQRPDPSEYDEFYGRYIDQVADGDVLEILGDGAQQTVSLLGEVSEEKANYAYAPGKWSIKEVVGHVIDAERCFAYRAFNFSRRDPAHLPSFEENDIAAASNADSRTLRDIMEEYESVRRATITLVQSLNDEMLTLTGTASGVEFSVRSIPFIIAGHEIHHRKVLQERYL